MKIGIDIGGNHISVGLIDRNMIIAKKDIEIKQFVNNNTETDIKNYILKVILDGIVDIIPSNKSIMDANIEKIGIACCGIVDKGKIIKAPNLKIYNFEIVSELKKELCEKFTDNCSNQLDNEIFNQLREKFFNEAYNEIQKKIENIEISLRNDAKCAALAEKEYGILKEYKDAIFMTVGTGIGGAYFNNHKLIEPVRNAGFEYGHMVICINGNNCTCDSKGCFETYASITALKKMVKDEFNVLNLGNNICSDTNICNKEITGKELFDFINNAINDLETKDTKEITYASEYKKTNEQIENAKKIENILEEYSKYLAIGISNLINILEPEIVVLGGSIVHYEKILLEKVKNKIFIFNRESKIPEIKMATLGNDAGILGAVL